mgnify:CR=1 FL=1
MAWDVTVPDTYAEFHIDETSAASDRAAALKVNKYASLEPTHHAHIFSPIAIETSGAWNDQAVDIVQEIGKRITAVTEDPLETMYLFQHISMAIQRGNAIAFLSTFDNGE